MLYFSNYFNILKNKDTLLGSDFYSFVYKTILFIILLIDDLASTAKHKRKLTEKIIQKALGDSKEGLEINK